MNVARQSNRSNSGCAPRQHPCTLLHHVGCRWRTVAVASSHRPAPNTQNTLDSLDALLGQSDQDQAGQPLTDLLNVAVEGKEELVEWWMVRPKQAAPPRQTGMAPGSHGRFVMSEDLLKLGELRVGRKTQLDGQLELPKVQPVLSFVLLLINLVCYGTYVNVNVLQGPDAAMDFLSGLWLVPSLALQDAPTQLAHALAATYMAPGPTELLVTLWALAVVAPRAESVMGYTSFLVIYSLSGISGSLVQLAIMADAPSASLGACGAAAAVLGVLGSLAVHHSTNRNVETQAASWRRAPPPGPAASSISPASTSSTSTSIPAGASSPASLFQPLTRQEASQRSALVQAVCLAVASLGLAGMQHLQGHPSDPGGGAGMWGEVAWGMGVVPQLVGLGTGMLLGLGMGPRYVVQRELHLDDGAMFIPEDAVDMLVVLDRTTSVQRGMTAAGVVAALALGWGAAGIS